jgi:hypothetical protein
LSGLARRAVLRIGGIAFDVRGSSLPFDQGLDRAYEGFAATAPALDDDVIPVDLAPGDAAPPPGARRVFDGGPSWSAFVIAEGGHAIAFATPEHGPVWCARFDRALSRVAVSFAPVLWNGGLFYSPMRHPLDQVLLMHKLGTQGGAIVHCAVVAVADRAVICPGVSGAGKTTLTRQLAGCGDLRVLSDDRAVVRRRGAGRWFAWGTPWPGEGGFAENRGLPLASIGFLEKAPATRIDRLSPVDAVKRLAKVASVPWYDRELGPRVFEGLAQLCAEVPAFTLSFAPDASAVIALRGLAAQALAPNSGSGV